MKDETTKTLEKKLRKLFRKKQRENFWLGFIGDRYQLVGEIPLGAYPELETELTDDELYMLKSVFTAYGKEESLFSIILKSDWFDRCCRDLKLFDSFSDRQLEQIVNNGLNSVWKLFFADGQTPERQSRIMYFLNKERLDEWICYLTKEEFSKFERYTPDFFTYLSAKADGEACSIFKKLASLSNCSIAKLFENLKEKPARRILHEIITVDRDIFEIVKLIENEKLYEVVIIKLDLLQNADIDGTEEWYFWLYSELPQEDKDVFLKYLFENKRGNLSSWGEKISAEMYRSMDLEDVRAEFVAELFAKQEAEKFELFYEELSLEEKERMFDDLLGYRDGEKIIRDFLNRREESCLLESLLKEKYVTQK